MSGCCVGQQPSQMLLGYNHEAGVLKEELPEKSVGVLGDGPLPETVQMVTNAIDFEMNPQESLDVYQC